jgi:PPIC-type PPIASE domain
VKRLIVLLIVMAGGVAAAAFLVPSDAATVNGSSVSQQTLNADVHAIAGSAYYQCYLNSQEYISSQGSQQLPAVVGAGTGQYAGDHPTATTAFTANYLSTEVGHQLVFEVAGEHHVTVTQAELKTARANLTQQISSVMSQILQTQQGQDVRYGCSLTGTAISGTQVLGSMPASFVDNQVQFVATATALQEDLAGVGSSDADLARYYAAHRAEFDSACVSAAVFSSESAAQDAASQVAFGTPFATVAANTASSGGGDQGCHVLSELESALPSGTDLKSLANGAVSAPIDDNGTYLLLQITSRTPTPYSKAKADVAAAVQAAGAAATQKALTSDERRASVSVNPQYGVWSAVNATVLTPLTPDPADVLNATANVGRVAPASVSGLGSSATGAGAGTSGAGAGAGTGTTGSTGTTGATGAGAATGSTGSTGTGAGSSTSTTG